MGTILASSIISNASGILHDETNVRWTAAQMLEWLNAGMREIVVLKPEAYVKNESVKMAAGTKQALPAGGFTFIDINRNMGANGTTPGRVPRFIEKKVIDAENPNWHKDAAKAEILHYTFDERDPSHFYCYPPQPAANQGYAELVYSAAPPDTASGIAIPLDDVYANPLVDYLLYRAYAKDPIHADKAVLYNQSFMTMVLGKKKFDGAVQPSKEKEA